MGKERKNSAIDQVMDELNEEVQSSLQPSPELFTFNFMDERNDASEGKNQENQSLASLIHFKPHQIEKEEVRKDRESTSHDEVRSSKKAHDHLSTNDNSSKKIEAKPDNHSVAQTSSLPEKEKQPKKVNKSKFNISLKSRGTKKSQPANVAYKLETSDQNIPMRITLQQSENLRVAQDRIVELETEIERLRTENEELIATGDIFRERLDKVIMQNNNLKKIYEESREEFQDEKRTLMDTLGDQGREIEKITIKNKELEKRLSSNLQQIRVRERELENRLELMKLDNQTLAREKDRYILDLKRNIDKMKMDLDSQKNKYNEMSQILEGYRNQSRRVTRGLQMILHIARGNNFSPEQEIKEKENK